MRLVPRSRARRAIAVLVAIMVLLALAAVRFLIPTQNPPERSDAVVVLGGQSVNGVNLGEKLVREGYAPRLVFSLNTGEYCRTGLVTPYVPSGVRISCFTAEPQTTQGEAREIAKLARSEGWHRVIVVATVPQVTRARLRVSRCYSGQLLVVGADEPSFRDWVGDLIYEWGAWLKAETIQSGC